MNDLQLVVTKNIKGELETNIASLESFVSERLKEYDVSLYGGDAVSAKKDRAELNNAKAQIAESRKALMKELMKPYTDFETRCKALEKDIDRASSALDAIVKVKENEEKEIKRATIYEMWNGKNFTLFPLDRIFDSRWLNKTYKMQDVENEIDVRIAQTYRDLKAIEKFAEDAETVKAHYLETLDIADALDWGEELIKNRERVRIEKEQRAEREHEKKIQEQKKEIRTECEVVNNKSRMSSLVADALADAPKPAPSKEWVISVSCNDTQLLAIKNFLTMQGIEITSCKELEF